MDPWGLINIADAYLDVYIGEYCKQEGITLSASAAKNKTFSLTEAHTINHFSFSHVRSLWISSLGQTQWFNNVPSLHFAFRGICSGLVRPTS